MKRSIKAALFSGLIFPGLGHMILKQYLRGSILILSTTIALAVIVTIAAKRALAVVDSINSGEIPVDAGAMMELASRSVDSADNSIANISMIVTVVCWLFGIIDSYRLGKTQDI